MIQAAFDVVALGFLGEDHGLVKMLGYDGGQGDAAGFGGEDDGDFVHVKVPAELLGNVVQQNSIYPVV